VRRDLGRESISARPNYFNDYGYTYQRRTSTGLIQPAAILRKPLSSEDGQNSKDNSCLHFGGRCSVAGMSGNR
jgi:hypothetical protein